MFTDPAGDSGGAPDVTAVAVSNTPDGTITIAVTTNQQTLAADAVLIVPIDADQNPSTGSPSGIEYSLVYRSTGYTYAKWNGTALSAAPPDALEATYANGVLRLTTTKAALGNTARFSFSVVSSQLASNQAVATDHAPDTGSYDYDLAAPPTAHLGRASGRIHAGKAFAIAAQLTATGGKVKVACSAAVARKHIRTHARVAGGRLLCTGVVPKAAAGKRLVGALTATVGSVKATSKFSLPIAK